MEEKLNQQFMPRKSHILSNLHRWTTWYLLDTHNSCRFCSFCGFCGCFFLLQLLQGRRWSDDNASLPLSIELSGQPLTNSLLDLSFPFNSKQASNPFAHTTELAGSELVPSRFLEAKHKELSFKVDHLLVDFFGGLGSDFLHLFFSLGHHHHGRRRGGARPPKRRRRETNADGAHMLESQAVEG